MKKIKINKIDETIYYEKLDNGLEVFLYSKKNIHNNYVTFNTKFGSMHNEFIPLHKTKMLKTTSGIAHFLEHKLFAQENMEDPPSFFASSGTSYNAHTTIKHTSYLFEGPNNLEENICFLLDFVQSPYFTDENVEQEKGIIIEEINMYKDTPWDTLINKIRLNTLNENKMRNSIIGEIKDIKKVTKEVLYDCYNTFYHPANMFLIVTGNFDVNKIIDLIKNNQKNKKFEEFKKLKLKETNEKDEVYKEKEIINLHTDIPKFAYTIKIPYKNFENLGEIKFLLYLYTIFSILFDDTSLLSEKLKNENIITNNTSIEIINVNNHFLVSLVNETKNYDILTEVIDNTLKNIKINKKDFERKKRVLISNLLFAYNDIVSINEIITDNIIYNGKIEENIYNLYESINYQEYQEILKKLNLSNKSIVIVEKK